MSPTLAVLWVALGILASGHALLAIFRQQPTDPLIRWGLATACGMAFTMLALYLPLMFTPQVAFTPVVVCHALALAWCVTRALVNRNILPSVPLLPLAIAAIAALLYLDIATTNPFNNYDAKAIYGFKAKVLLAEGTLDTPAFQDSDVVHYHPDYPLGWPLLMTYVGWAAGGAPDALELGSTNASNWSAGWRGLDASMALDLLWALGFLCLVAGWTRASGRHPARWLLVGCVPLALIAPWDTGASWRGTPELPLALCLAAAAWLLVQALDRPTAQARRALLLPTATCIAAAMLLKQDALLGAGSLCVAAASLRLHAPRHALRWILGGAALGLLPVILVRAAIADASFDEHYLAALQSADFGAWLQHIKLLPMAVYLALNSADMILFWVFVVCVAIPIGWRSGPRTRLLATAVAVHLVVCLAIFVVTPNHAHWHVRTALVRLWAQMCGPACFLAISAGVQIWSRVRSPESLHSRGRDDEIGRRGHASPSLTFAGSHRNNV